MQYDQFERADAEYSADTVGLRPGIAGFAIEHQADVFCPECTREMLGDDLFQQAKQENVMHDEYGNVAAVLSSEEWDCPGARCGHCGISLDVRVIHYDAVCQPDTCPEM